MRNGRVRLLSRGSHGRSLPRRPGRRRGPGRELVCLVREGPAAGIHLEQQRLGRLAREPELAAIGVVAVALVRNHRSVRGLEQLRRGHEPDALEQPERGRVARGELRQRPGSGDRRRSGDAGIAVDDHGQAPEPFAARVFEQLEPPLRVSREHGRCAPGQRRRDRALGAGLRLERRQRQRLSRLGQRARRRRNPLPLRDCALERLQALAGRARPLCDVVALGGCGTGRVRRLVRPLLERRGRRVASTGRGARLLELARQAFDERRHGLAAHAQPLARGPQCDEPGVGALPAAGRLGKRFLDGAALGAEAGERRVGLGGEAPLVRGETSMGEASALRRLTVSLDRIARASLPRSQPHPRARGPPRRCDRPPPAQPRRARRAAAARAPWPTRAGAPDARSRPGAGRGRRARPRGCRRRRKARPRPAAAPRAAPQASPASSDARSRRRRGAPRCLPAAPPLPPGRAGRHAPATPRSRRRASRPAPRPWPGAPAAGAACGRRPRRPSPARPGSRRGRA